LKLLCRFGRHEWFEWIPGEFRHCYGCNRTQQHFEQLINMGMEKIHWWRDIN